MSHLDIPVSASATASTATPLADRFFRRGAEFLGCRYPVICGAMTWVSDPNLVAAVHAAGGFGCLAGGNTPPEILERQITETRERTGNCFGVNVIVIAPAYKAHLELIRSAKPPFIIFAGSFPHEREVRQVKETGAKVLCFASTQSIAERMIRYGADGIILEGSESGGHIGHVALSVLLQQVLFTCADKVPVFVAGGVGTARMSAHLFLMGAAGVQLGTRFAASTESCAHAKFKDMFLRAEARDAVSTPQFDSRLPVVAVRALRNKGHEEFRKLQLALVQQLEAGTIRREQAQMEVEKFWMGALRRAVIDGDVEHGSLMAGQSVGLVERIESVDAIMNDLVTGTEAELQRVKATLA